MSAAREPSERLLRLGQILSQQTIDGRDTADADPLRTRELQTERIRLLTLELQHGSIHHDQIDAVAMRLLLNDCAAAVAALRNIARQAESLLTAASGSVKEAQRYLKRQEKWRRKQEARSTDS
ncbi:MAG TPA: hypothetical protein VFO67_12455 [Gemmatimonadales bacterium]|nr:hypothetical protein [Gemmatimonadales bacterium]